jgi:hypothetical protein
LIEAGVVAELLPHIRDIVFQTIVLASLVKNRLSVTDEDQVVVRMSLRGKSRK